MWPRKPSSLSEGREKKQVHFKGRIGKRDRDRDRDRERREGGKGGEETERNNKCLLCVDTLLSVFHT